MACRSMQSIVGARSTLQLNTRRSSMIGTPQLSAVADRLLPSPLSLIAQDFVSKDQHLESARSDGSATVSGWSSDEEPALPQIATSSLPSRTRRASVPNLKNELSSAKYHMKRPRLPDDTLANKRHRAKSEGHEDIPTFPRQIPKRDGPKRREPNRSAQSDHRKKQKLLLTQVILIISYRSSGA